MESDSETQPVIWWGKWPILEPDGLRNSIQ